LSLSIGLERIVAPGIAADDPERLLDLVLLDAAADVQEVGGLAFKRRNCKEVRTSVDLMKPFRPKFRKTQIWSNLHHQFEVMTLKQLSINCLKIQGYIY
jgi:hypothetical protein